MYIVHMIGKWYNLNYYRGNDKKIKSYYRENDKKSIWYVIKNKRWEVIYGVVSLCRVRGGCRDQIHTINFFWP